MGVILRKPKLRCLSRSVFLSEWIGRQEVVLVKGSGQGARVVRGAMRGLGELVGFGSLLNLVAVGGVICEFGVIRKPSEAPFIYLVHGAPVVGGVDNFTVLDFITAGFAPVINLNGLTAALLSVIYRVGTFGKNG